MAEIHVSADREMAAPPETVYRCLADYRQHHANILPPAFTDFQVESRGVGEGTVVRFQLHAGRRVRSYRMKVDEPEPGRVLTESDTASTLVTAWTVSPDGSGSTVRIDTRWQGAGGVGGFFERTFAPRVLRQIYSDELERLDRYTQEMAAE